MDSPINLKAASIERAKEEEKKPQRIGLENIYGNWSFCLQITESFPNGGFKKSFGLSILLVNLLNQTYIHH